MKFTNITFCRFLGSVSYLVCNKFIAVLVVLSLVFFNSWGQEDYISTLQKASAFRNNAPDSALMYASKALQNRNIQQDTAQWMIALNLMHNINAQFGDFEEAIKYTLQQEKLARTSDDTSSIIRSLKSIAYDHIRLSLTDKAFNYMTRALWLSKQSNIQTRDVAVLYSNIGDLYRTEKKDYRRALAYNDSAIQMAKTLRNDVDLAFFLTNRCELYIALEEYDKAMVFAKQARKSMLSFDEARSNPLYLSFTYQCMGVIHRERGDFQQAKSKLLKALELAQKVNGVQTLASVYKDLAITAEREENYVEALGFYRQFKTLDDSIRNQKNQEQVLAMQYQYDARSNLQQIEMLKKDQELAKITLKNQRWISYSLGIVLVLIFIFSVVLYRGYETRRKNIAALQKQNEEITAKNDEIQAQKSSIESQKQLLEQQNLALDQLNQENNSLISIVAHDLKAPMKQINGLISILNFESENLRPPQKEVLTKIEESAKRAIELITKLLDIEALESQRSRVELGLHNLVPIVSNAITTLETQAKAKDIQLYFSTSQTPIQGKVDDSLARQIIENLLSNAIKFSPFHKNIYLALAETEDVIAFSVRDEGPGISQDEMYKLFEKFQKLSARPTAGEASSGLGLSIVKKYAEAMGGSVSCQSEEGNGATFTVTFKKA